MPTRQTGRAVVRNRAPRWEILKGYTPQVQEAVRLHEGRRLLVAYRVLAAQELWKVGWVDAQGIATPKLTFPRGWVNAEEGRRLWEEGLK